MMENPIRDPRFLCENCGFGNVRLTPEGALCTNCGTKYKRL